MKYQGLEVTNERLQTLMDMNLAMETVCLRHNIWGEVARELSHIRHREAKQEADVPHVNLRQENLTKTEEHER